MHMCLCFLSSGSKTIQGAINVVCIIESAIFSFYPKGSGIFVFEGNGVGSWLVGGISLAWEEVSIKEDRAAP